MKESVNVKQINEWDFYPTYEAYVDMMYQFGTDYPELCEVFSIGQSINGRELLFVRISDNISQQEGEPQFLYTATMHGDETAGYVLTLRLIDFLLSNYGSDPEVDNLVDNLDIWINPLANPDGTYWGGNGTVNGAIRYNANGVDLNRNYPDPEDGPHPDGNEWQQETVMFMQLAEETQFVSGANFHGGTEVCNYPWDTWAMLHPDDDWWQYVCRQYADTAQTYSPPGFMTGYNNGITNGYQWYTISGGRQDYMNYFHQCREFTLEISDTKLLPASLLPDWWDYNYRSMLNYMKQALFGLSGTVTDAETGDPVKAEVFIENHDSDSSWVYTYDLNGAYYRPLYEGMYDVTFSAPGYYSQTFENVDVQNEALTLLDVELEGGELIADFSASDTKVPVGSTIDFEDLTFGDPVTWEWTFEGGEPGNAFVQNPQGILYNEVGSYDVSLTVSDGNNSQTITKEDYILVNEEFIIQNTTVTTCTGIFYDSGGEEGNYSDNEDFIMTFLPVSPDAMVSLDFIAFDVEWQSNCIYDWLRIFDGSSTSSTLIGEYCGTNSPGLVVATNPEGALTVQFHSDGGVTGAGWTALISCEGLVLPPIADFQADDVEINVGEAVSFNDLSTNDPDSWEWIFESGSPGSSSFQSPMVTYFDAGTWDVTLTVSNSAGSNTITKENYITVAGVIGLEENAMEDVQVVPNPARDVCRIQSKEPMQSLQLRSLDGRLLIEALPGETEKELGLEGLTPGTYILSIQFRDRIILKKLQIVR
jgi:PKD repeat protein